MSARLDVVGFAALDARRHMLRVSNAQLLEFVHARLQSRLLPEQVELYERLLASDRSRFVASSRIDESLDDDHRTRYERYRDRSGELALACIDQLRAEVPFDSRQVRAVVTNTTVGGMVPNLSSRVGRHLGLAPDVSVIDLGYMGCATALLALEIVEQQLRPGQLGLVVSSEITSAMVNLCATSDASLVANTVFGDGVGVFLVARRPHPHRAVLHVVGHAGSVLTDEQALAAITYEPNAVYHEIRLQPSIPEVAGRGIRLVVEPLVRRHLVSVSDRMRYLWTRRVPRWQRNVAYAVLHTAGTKVLEGVTAALQLERSQVEHNFEAFREHGNTSSASLYYALDGLWRNRRPRRGQRLLFLGYGSGFLTRGCVMEVA